MGLAVILDQYRLLCDVKGILKEQYKKVTKKEFHHAINFIDHFDDEMVRFVLI